MLAQVGSGAVLGVDAYAVRVEVDVGRGLPCLSVVGLPENAVREGRERVSAALRNCGLEMPARRITVNLAPADVPKGGSAFDLPIALGILAGSGQIPTSSLDGVCAAGELGLDGELRPIRGALPIALRCARENARELLVPEANAAEAAVVDRVRVIPATSLAAVLAHLSGRRPIAPAVVEPDRAEEEVRRLDLADVRGQELARRAIEVAAAGAHNLLMIGPPGTGKSMLARRLPGILPRLDTDESIEVTRIHSVAGLLPPGAGLVRVRPFRAPHHSVSEAGLIGGGGIPRPGEVSLAHEGVLFLDELPEFGRRALESLRQPLEDGVVHIGRARLTLRFPARFMLVAAMNPCPCGHHGDDRCTCDDGRIDRYRSRVSGPLWDRFDMHVEVPAVDPATLRTAASGEPSDDVADRVAAARLLQQRRLDGRRGVRANGHMEPVELRRWCRLDAAGAKLLTRAAEVLRLSARGHDRVLRVARTIADLAGAERIAQEHLAEAIQYRSMARA